MNLMIFGYKRHGKDTACEYLRDKYGITFASSSETACDLFIFDKLKNKYKYSSKEECFNDRHNHRQEWYELICEYNKDDPARLGKYIFSNNDVYCGIRDDKEFQQLKKEGCFKISIWIDASDRLPPEEITSMKLSKKDADFVIKNNKGLKDLYCELDLIYQKIIKPVIEKEQEVEFTF